MKNKIIISVKEAISLIKNNKFNNDYTINFKNEKVDAFDAMLLEKNGVDVPENLIFYDDDKIDFSDIPEIDEEDIISGKVIQIVSAEIPLDYETREWIKKEKINLNEFSAKLIKNFYENIKSLYKKTAL